MLDLIGNVTLGTGFPSITDVHTWNRLAPPERVAKAQDKELHAKFGPYTHIHTDPHWNRFEPVMATIDGYAKEFLFDDKTIPLFSLEDAYLQAYDNYADATIRSLYAIPDYGEEMAARYAFYVFRQTTTLEPLYPLLTPSVLDALCSTVKEAECTIEEVS